MKRHVRAFLRRDTHPAAQFVKYGLAGVIATAVDVGMFYLISLAFIPALRPDDKLLLVLGQAHEALTALFPGLTDAAWLKQLLVPDVPDIAESVRSRNFLINRGLAFIFSNLTAYVLNALWVFVPGRHERHMEIALFYAVSIVSFVTGTTLGWLLIRLFGTGTTEAVVVNIFASVMINFVCRKYVVFKH